MKPPEIRARILELVQDLAKAFQGLENLRQDPVKVIDERAAKGQEIMDTVDKLFKIIELYKKLDDCNYYDSVRQDSINTQIEKTWRSF